MNDRTMIIEGGWKMLKDAQQASNEGAKYKPQSQCETMMHAENERRYLACHFSFQSYRMHFILPDPPFSSLPYRRLVRLGADGLRLHLLWLANDLIRSTLDDTASLGKLSANAHEVGIDVTSCLATFIDAPTGYQQFF